MNNRISLVYQLLLLISVISSGVLFIIVAAEHGINIGTSHKEKEQLREENLMKLDVEKTVHDKPVDYDSTPYKKLKDEERQIDQQIRSSFDEAPSEEIISLKDQPVAGESGSLFQNHASITDEFSETGHAVVFTLVDSASQELQQQAAVVTKLLAASADTDNDTTAQTQQTTTKVTSAAAAAAAAGPVTVPLPLESDATANQTSRTDDLYVVRAEPKQVDATSQPISASSSSAAAAASSAEGGTGGVGSQVKSGSGAEGGASATLQDAAEDGTPSTSETAAAAATVVEDKAAANETATNTTSTASGGGEVASSHEEIPSFSEWAQKQLAEAEKKKAENKTRGGNGGGAVGSGGGGGGSPRRGMKQRSKNYASPDCGAKVVSTNPEASSVWAVLSSSRDEYLLNSCNNKIWFIVELCEAIQPEKIELANFELFSSILREFSVSVSDRHPTREWTQVGQYEAKEVRTIQNFSLKPTSAFVKYIRVEFHSHYGAEHYCPISLFRVYGTSEFEVLDTVDEAHTVTASLEEDEDEFEEGGGESVEKPRNLFSSARDAVLSIVKRAAEALVKGEGGEGGEGNRTASASSAAQDAVALSPAPPCVTPAYIIVCDNCSDALFNSVHHELSCHGKELEGVLETEWGGEAVARSEACKARGLDLQRGGGAPFPMPARTSAAAALRTNQPSHYLHTMLPDHTVIALCNLLAISRKQVVLNITYDLSEEIQQSGEAVGETLTVTHPDAPLMPNTVASASPSTCTLNSTTASSSSQDASAGTGSKDAGSQTVSSASVQIKPTKTFLAEDMHSLPVDAEASQPNATSDGDGDFGNRTSTVTESVPVVTASQPVKVVTEDQTVTASENLGSEESMLDLQEEAVATAGDSLTFDSIFSELDEVESPDPASSAPTTAAASTSASSAASSQQPATLSPPQTQQRESVFLRLAKRIKALERNMSLSGQYLEELSRRYKRQVEEMQRALNEVVEERRRLEEKEERRGQQVAQLSGQVAKLTLTLEALIDERNSWSIKHGAVIIVEVVVFAVILLVCRWLPDAVELGGRSRFAWQKQQQQRRVVSSGSEGVGAGTAPRRSSIDGSSPLARPYPGHPRLRKRRPSEEALRISGSTHQDLLIPDASRKNSRAENRRRRRKKKEQQQQQATFYVDVDRNSWTADRQATAVDNESGSANERREALAPPPPPPLPPPVVAAAAPKERRNYVVPVVVNGSEDSSSSLPPLLAPPPPNYMQTALSIRKKRNSLRGQSSSEFSDSSAPSASSTKLNISPSPSLIAKKSGPLKKIMKKLF